MEGVSLTARDKAILLMVYEYDRVGIAQVARRFFNNLTTATVRVWRLIGAKYLRADRVPNESGYGAGRYLLGIGPQGRRVLGLSAKEVSSLNHLEKLYPLNHHLACCDFRVGLELDCASRKIALYDWKTDKTLQGAKERPTPDASFILGNLGFRLEMDMATVPRKRMLAKLTEYVKKRDDRRLVLWDVPDERRAFYLLEWIKEVGFEQRADVTMFLVGVRAQNPLSPVWRVVGLPHPVSLIGGRRSAKT